MARLASDTHCYIYICMYIYVRVYINSTLIFMSSYTIYTAYSYTHIHSYIYIYIRIIIIVIYIEIHVQRWQRRFFVYKCFQFLYVLFERISRIFFAHLLSHRLFSFIFIPEFLRSASQSKLKLAQHIIYIYAFGIENEIEEQCN